MRGLATLAALFATAPAFAQAEQCDRELVVLGAGQDAGAPQIGNADDNGPRLLPSSLGLIDRAEGKRYLFDATPAITEQLAMLDAIEPPKEGLGIDGIFLTHAHIGHYLGLAYLGREAASAKNVPVYAMPRMAEFLRTNGPWSQLVELGNIRIERMVERRSVDPFSELRIAPITVPHRDEFSETVGFAVFTAGPNASQKAIRTAFYFPDFDSWAGWKNSLRKLSQGQDFPSEHFIQASEYVFVDATFYDDNELPGRDMSEIPHPRVTETMDLLQGLPAEQRAKVHFIHYNHTNPIRDPNSPQSKEVEAKGFNIARRGDRFCLD